MSEISKEGLQNGHVTNTAPKRKSNLEAISETQVDVVSPSSSSPNDHPLTQADPIVLPKVARIGYKTLLFEDYEKKAEDLYQQVSGFVKLIGFIHELNDRDRTMLLAKLLQAVTSVHEEMKLIKPEEKTKELYSLLTSELSTTHRCSKLLVTFLEKEEAQ